MTTAKMYTTSPWLEIEGPNLGYIQEQYERYLNDQESVDMEWRELFSRWGGPPTYSSQTSVESEGNAVQFVADMSKLVSAVKLIQHLRIHGHQAANVNSFKKQEYHELLDPAAHGLSKDDLEKIPAKILFAESPEYLKNGADVVGYLQKIYTGTTAYQFTHIHDREEWKWLNHMVETGAYRHTLSTSERKALLEKLTDVEEFEHFLHRTFAGQKRFSLEGLDILVPMLQELIREGAIEGTETVLMGMAHRGRLNVLAHVLEKPYEAILSEFYHSPHPELVPSEGSIGMSHGWTGDVKYHLGADRELEIEHSNPVRIVLANNPSHLEFVGSVVEGYTRAAQEERKAPGAPKQDLTKAFAILVHGDAAFPGEGIVAETLNLSRLKGYNTGGTIHIIANNQIGFTTDSEDSRSTQYASDLAKGFEIPIVRVNADDPEACLQVIHLAFEYRNRFHKDFLIDLVGFRRFGHNEMDDPFATQPIFYHKVSAHPGVRTLYAEELAKMGTIKKEEDHSLIEASQRRLKEAYEKVKSGKYLPDDSSEELQGQGQGIIQSSVSVDDLLQVTDQLLEWPPNFQIYPKLDKILQRRKEAFEDDGKVDFGHAETLAFATILRKGVPIRFTGQDTQRGTFAHRNLVLHDQQTGAGYMPLQHLPGAKASFSVYNSALSEAAVLGFEYGYDGIAQDTLVLWEAQFGDFVNAAQVLIDTFLAAGEAKWGQSSHLVMLLPHGYEGQGPEHSSARPERFLQLAAENNMRIAIPTSAGQYYHLLREQAAFVGTRKGCPLILFTPKGLLRHPEAASRPQDLAAGMFQPVQERTLESRGARRLILCTGKISIELETALNTVSEAVKNEIKLIRVEQLYPFPEEELRRVLESCQNLQELVWVQEEPRNMGAWTFIEPRLRGLTNLTIQYIGRPDRSSPAEGLADVHKAEQQRIIQEATSGK
ncbi:2-oxoglutarate dehydrogenase E1 component [Ammoniphilus resinae]|uniref:2-oxoglutarate dehydrogenase E1 component n=1 Tax=Ammoniphilus resinae TaxID=861532 RepID=A0ABS4GU88_9BACL|nr:2-oxoglutarate dehydrogenase E1 component [Ammoniphilus resinae]MBP1933841.1 2-oxoglutarate dehydrogenase E1 component [Ammoniphilus resinae]